MYTIEEVDGIEEEATIRRMNGLCPDIFPELEPHHIEDGYWWLTYHNEIREPVAFAGMVSMSPFANVCYFKRCLVLPDHVGHGLQLRMLFTREVRARDLGYEQLISECSEHSHSNLNFRRANWEQVAPEQPWQPNNPGTVYWSKTL